MNLRKILLSFVLSLGAGGILSAQELPKNLSIPSKYENYRNNEIHRDVFYLGENKVLGRFYDVDNDGDIDVGEIYPVIGEDEVNYMTTPNPIMYGFNLNDNEIFEENEILTDEKIDGLNGNEKSIVPKNIKLRDV